MERFVTCLRPPLISASLVQNAPCDIWVPSATKLMGLRVAVGSDPPCGSIFLVPSQVSFPFAIPFLGDVMQSEGYSSHASRAKTGIRAQRPDLCAPDAVLVPLSLI